MARKTTITIPGNRRASRPRNTAARALRSALYRPRVSKNPKAYSRNRQKRPELPGDESE